MRLTRSKKSTKSVGLDETKTQLLFENGVDEHSRTIIINSEITEELAFHIDVSITHLEKLSNDPINIRLTTGGGSVIDANSIIDRILNSTCEIHIHATGEICSAGIFVLASGHYRTCSFLLMLMHHEPSYDIEGRHSHNKGFIKASEAQDLRMAKWLATRTKKDAAFWLKTGVSTDYYFTPEQALDYGLIDEIIK